MMIHNKKWYQSKTVWAAGAAFLVACLSAAFGETHVVTALAVAILSTLGVYGRVTAKERIQ